MKLTELKVNHVTAPLGFQTSPLSFSWKVDEAGEAKSQSWARIRICCGENCVFDSGEDADADSMDYTVEI